jgi:hypothetical protein
MLLALQLAGREFCSKTEVWTESLPAIDLLEGVLSYTLEWDQDAIVRRVKSVKINGAIISPELYEFVPSGVLVLSGDMTPAVTVTGGLVVELVFVPRLTTSEISEMVFDRWAEAITAKAVHSLGMQPNKPWSNPTVALFALTRYNEKISEAMAEAASKYKSGGSGLEA